MSTVKIARGASRKAEVTGTQPTGYSDRPYLSATPWPYWTLGGPGVSVTSYQGSAWNVTEDATVTVPHDAPLGAYTGTVYRNRQDTNGDGYYDSGEKVFFAFDVVCMTVKIATTEIYRDANVYRLLCTAQVQGGTAPYAYAWSSNVPGSTAVSGQNAQTCIIQLPVGAAGTISVNVTDSSNPQCLASDSFNVCGLTCDFTASLVSSPPAGQTGPYVYECQASVSGGTGPFTYEWVPSPETLIEPNGRTVRIAMPDNKRRAIRLTATDSTGCKGFKTRYVGVVHFNVTTNPGSSSPGRVQGERAAMQFYVTVEATADGEMDNPPATITFELYRRKTGAISTLTGNLVAGSNPVKYEGQWSVTSQAGRWEIKVQGYVSNTLQFKIDKREQIDYLANSYVGAPKVGQLGICEEFTGVVYGHLGLSYPANANASVIGEGNPNATPPIPPPTAPDTKGYGCMTLFHGNQFPPRTWQHIAINAGIGSVVDQNCGSAVSNPQPGPGEPVPPALIDKHSPTASHLSQPNHYEVREDRNTHEMLELDSE